jgi:hypothetical protein
MSGDLPDYYFRVRENGAVVFRVDTENRQRRIDMEEIATVNINNGKIKPHRRAADVADKFSDLYLNAFAAHEPRPHRRTPETRGRERSASASSGGPSSQPEGASDSAREATVLPGARPDRERPVPAGRCRCAATAGVPLA